jgi:hypothetical protein
METTAIEIFLQSVGAPLAQHRRVAATVERAQVVCS